MDFLLREHINTRQASKANYTPFHPESCGAIFLGPGFRRDARQSNYWGLRSSNRDDLFPLGDKDGQLR